ncbi:lipoyl protein ligase domain-containing protein [Oscillatoria salina]|uniref:lipoyl protein ligase domain-containing protein n=1 Tax=Oscillatoria salina TaxID=331517 RepID=UPI0013BC04ED|nr:biotin/lipoate A/B protein ligase family protein [Oscillatoria salina]MBZ8181962.1 lipoate--protein ligase family protein [Oscillatoria salina IIICB1]NET89340.1 lipoate--protein ligase family protein [Kamptonema sp. SIO1D9]
MKWRLIPLLSASGTTQMAIDRWLLQQHRLGKHPPSLRFYTWSPVAISLGYHQHNFPDFWQNLTWEGKEVDLVRRPTGGRAVLHQDDLTYMVVTSGISGTRSQIYQQICAFLLRGWSSLGVELHYGNTKRGYIHNPNCFGTATAADLVTTNGEKLIGSAQLIKNDAILQHGSLYLSRDNTLFAKVFNEHKSPVKLPWQQPKKALIETIVNSLSQAAIDCFNIDLITQPLSEAEWQEILAQPNLK